MICLRCKRKKMNDGSGESQAVYGKEGADLFG